MNAALLLVIFQATNRQKFAAATASDLTLRLIKHILIRGWLKQKAQCAVAAKPIWSVWHCLSEADELLLRGSVVPVSLLQEVMGVIHDDQFGEVQCVL